MHCEPPQITFIPCEEHFRPVLPTIEGNVEQRWSMANRCLIWRNPWI